MDTNEKIRAKLVGSIPKSGGLEPITVVTQNYDENGTVEKKL